MTEETFAPAVAEDTVLEDAGYLIHSYGRYPVEFVRGDGAKLYDVAGNEYLDFLAGIGCVSLGHANPEVGEALKAQIDKIWQPSNYFYSTMAARVAHGLSVLLSTICTEGGHISGSTGTHWKTFFANSGAEANEGAFKLARRWGERSLGGASVIVSAKKSFHGRTLATLAATGQERFHASFGPFPPGFISVELNDLDALLAVLDDPEIGYGGVCAVVLECVQGEGGVYNADYDYVRALRRETKKRGILLLIDEVQTGFYRCGSPFAFQRFGIEPDIVSCAKGIAGGFPMGAVCARDAVADLIGPGDHGSTFGGNALAVAAAGKTLTLFAEKKISVHVYKVGKYLRHRLSILPHVIEVRGHGLMRGAELDLPIAGQVVEEGLKRGLVLNHIGDSILRFLPPLVITEEEIDLGMDRLQTLIADIADKR